MGCGNTKDKQAVANSVSPKPRMDSNIDDRKLDIL